MKRESRIKLTFIVFGKLIGSVSSDREFSFQKDQGLSGTYFDGGRNFII